MIRSIALLMALVVLDGAIGSEVVLAQRTVGVSSGFRIEYAMTYSGNATLPETRQEWVKVIVEEVDGTEVTYEQTEHKTDDSEVRNTFTVDVDTGAGTSAGMFIAADLHAGDLIYADPYSDLFVGATINETTHRSYLGQLVEVNRWNITKTPWYPPFANHTGSVEYWWLRSTGALVEAVGYLSNVSLVGDRTVVTWRELRAAVMDMVPEFHSPVALALFMMAALIALVAYRKRSSAKTVAKPQNFAPDGLQWHHTHGIGHSENERK